MQKITYKSSGVDIGSAEAFKKKLKERLDKAYADPCVIKGVGGFGSLFRFPKDRYNKPVLVSSCDGIGTKIKIALLAGKHDTVGIDAVAMNVNDILCAGARPLFFLDYIAHSNLKKGVLLSLVKGINDGCIQAGCSLIGGETAQMPGMYKNNEYDVAGFCVGVAEESELIDGSGIKAGDLVIGIESSGLHSNGYSLVRKALSIKEQKAMKNELLIPTRIYVKPLLSILKSVNSGKARAINGIANITGGAFYDKIARILPKGVDAVIDKSSWPTPALFRLIQKKGGIEDAEIYHTLNMGIGMVLVVRSASARGIVKKLSSFKLKSWVIGKTVRGRKEVRLV